MIKIAFCDDDVSVLDEMQGFLDQYCRERKRSQEIIHTVFQSPVDMMVKIEQGIRFDILFLDILMPGQNGIETAAEIRSYDKNIKIIFLSSSAEFAVQSYTVEAYLYLLKPLRWEAFLQVIDSVLEKYELERESRLILHCKNGITSLDPERLEYCEVIHHTLLFHLSCGKVLESTGSLDELSRRLKPHGYFLRPHRSYLVNLGYIQSISYKAITMFSQAEIPVPRGKYKEIKDAFLEYAFRDGRLISSCLSL